MAETANIAKMAEKISNELFLEFFWNRTGPTNISWPCEKSIEHKARNHPSDVVFYYDDPYFGRRVYVNCDLKSYARGSINNEALEKAFVSLAKQVACAEVSEKWRELYIHDNVTPVVVGLLFVYNHDGEYDKDFRKRISHLQTVKLDLPKGARIIILGPDDIFWLDNVRYELSLMRGRRGGNLFRLPDPEFCKFFYPHLARRKNIELERAKAMTLEMLTSNLIALEYTDTSAKLGKGIILFYRGEGSRQEEFSYLFDYLRHFQLLKDGIEIEIKLLNAAPSAQTMFQKAQQSYCEDLNGERNASPLSLRIKEIRYSRISQVISKFSDIELGMEHA